MTASRPPARGRLPQKLAGLGFAAVQRNRASDRNHQRHALRSTGMEVAPIASNTSARHANDGRAPRPDRASHPAGGIMTDHTFRDAEIVRAIDTELLRRRQQFEGQPVAWSILCEAAHVATLSARADRLHRARGSGPGRGYRPAAAAEGGSDPGLSGAVVAGSPVAGGGRGAAGIGGAARGAALMRRPAAKAGNRRRTGASSRPA